MQGWDKGRRAQFSNSSGDPSGRDRQRQDAGDGADDGAVAAASSREDELEVGSIDETFRALA